MFCTNCGAQIEEGTSTCANCGYIIQDGDTITEQSKGINLLPFLLGGVLLIIAIFAAIFAMLLRGPDYTKGTVIKNTYTNEWADIQLKIPDAYEIGEYADYMECENETTECGMMLKDTQTGEDLTLYFEDLRETAKINEEVYLEQLVSEAIDDGESLGFEISSNEFCEIEIAGKKHLACELDWKYVGKKQIYAVRIYKNHAIVYIVNQTEDGKTDELLSSITKVIDKNITDENNESLVKKDIGTYTVLLYMVGSNLESEGGAASKDLMEIMNSGVDTSRVNVLVYTGGSQYWHSGISNEVNSVYHLNGTGSSATLEFVGATDANLNMGEAETFASFIDFGYENYPADHYALICWDHGSGPVSGFGNDELFEYDSLLLPELEVALGMTSFGEENKFDWIGYDACLMASIELAQIWDEYADYMIASQETEPSYGWDYSFLSVLNETSNPVKIAKHLIDKYEESYEEMTSVLFNPELTLSCMRLSEVENVTEKMDDLFYDIELGVSSGDFTKVARARENVKSFGVSAVGSKGDSLDIIDLGNYTGLMSEDYPDEVLALLNAIDDLVIYESTNIYGSSGVSIYHPYHNQVYFERAGKLVYDAISDSEGYKSYVKAFSDMWLNGSTETKDKVRQANKEKEVYQIQLSEEQMDIMSSITYTIMWEIEEGLYFPVLCDCKVEPDEEGVISIDMEQNILSVKGAKDSEGIWMIRQLSSDTSGITYQTVNTKVSTDPAIYMGGSSEPVTVTLFAENGINDIVVQSIDTEAEDVLIGGKNNIELSRWSALEFHFRRYAPTYNDEQSLLPYTEWEPDNWHMLSTTALDDSFAFEWKKTSDYVGEKFVCQVVLEDVNGNVYPSDILELKANSKAKFHEQETKKGVMTYAIFKESAKLISYEGKDKKLEIPNKIKGVPVTEIGAYAFGSQMYPQRTIEEIIVTNNVKTLGEGAFAYCSALKKITLPEKLKELPRYVFSNSYELEKVEVPVSVKRIGAFAFATTSIKKLELPKGITKIGEAAFAGCFELTDLKFVEKNKKYKIEDNVLFTADGKKLLACPGNNKTSYVIPEGVEEICDYAFYGAYEEPFPYSLYAEGSSTFGTLEDFPGLREITFPSTLKRIGDGAFLGCIGFKKIVFPDSLDSIGHFAFASVMYQQGETIDEICVGKNVWIGEMAFDGYNVGKIIKEESSDVRIGK